MTETKIKNVVCPMCGCQMKCVGLNAVGKMVHKGTQYELKFTCTEDVGHAVMIRCWETDDMITVE